MNRIISPSDFIQIMYIQSMTADDNVEGRLDDLDALIRYLEEEKDRLKKRVEDAAKEWEFSEAKALAKAHRHVVRRLHNLKLLRDPGLDERACHYRMLVFLKYMLSLFSCQYRFAPITQRNIPSPGR